MAASDLNLSANERLVIDTVRRAEPITRAAVHTMVPLTQPSVHRIVDNLNREGLLKTGVAVIRGPGKPSPNLHLDRESVYSAGIAVNTDEIVVCLANLACEPVGEVSLKGLSGDRLAALARIKQELDTLLVDAQAGEGSLIGVGLAIAGTFLEDRSHVNASLPLEDWSLINLHEETSRFLDAEVWIENVGATAAIGESLIGAGRWTKNFVYLSFDYGFGGGAIIDGQPYVGAHGNSLEVSSIYTAEEKATRPALENLINHLRTRGHDVKSIDELAELDPTWTGVEEWVDLTVPALNRAIWAIRGILDPEVIVLGGALPKTLADLYLDRLSVYSVDEHRYGAPEPPPRIMFTEASDVGPALGAALLPLKSRLFA